MTQAPQCAAVLPYPLCLGKPSPPPHTHTQTTPTTHVTSSCPFLPRAHPPPGPPE
jgi:hypothetical protein